MHQEVLDFLSKTKIKHPEYFKSKRVLELGSLDINGSPRSFFEDCEYIGIDRQAGRGVDVVCKAHEFKSRKKFDVIISTEMLEHDKYSDETIKNAWRLLKSGGIMIFTAANVNRTAHYEWVGEDNHYENISKEKVESWIEELGVENYEIKEDDKKQDIRFIFFKLDKKNK